MISKHSTAAFHCQHGDLVSVATSLYKEDGDEDAAVFEEMTTESHNF
jgi:hypothetical protein